jgi:WD40 repeat protein
MENEEQIPNINQINNLQNIVSKLQDQLSKINEQSKIITNSNSILYSIQSDISKVLTYFTSLIKPFLSSSFSNLKIENFNFTISMLKPVVSTQHLQNIWSMTNLKHKSFATGSYKGELSIFSINVNKKTWNQDIYLQKAHEDGISTLSQVKGDKLLSGSKDTKIKLWGISSKELTQLAEFIGHTNYVKKVITLTQHRFASCSYDKTIHIWQGKMPYNKLSVLNDDIEISSVIQLTNDSNVLVSPGPKKTLSVWNMKNMKKEHVVKNVWTGFQNGLIELQNGLIAVSSEECISIVDINKYAVIKHLNNEEVVIRDKKISSICLCDENTFAFVHSGWFCVIDCETLEVVFKVEINGEFKGSGIVVKNEGLIIITVNNKGGFTVYKRKPF